MVPIIKFGFTTSGNNCKLQTKGLNLKPQYRALYVIAKSKPVLSVLY